MPADEKELLCRFVKNIHPITDEEEEVFAEHWKPMTAKRKTILTVAGETERYLYFVLDGVQRAFYLSDDCIYLCSFFQRCSR
jgi:CRP-like cAMP-binding protein